MKAEVWEGKDGWRWRIVRNGRITATSGEAFASKRNAKRALANFLWAVKTTPLTEAGWERCE